jgi:small subunit ribosomal protein S2
MKEYIFGERNGIYIIDLQKTQKLFRDALNYVTEAVTEKPNMKILFVGTKRQAQDAIKEEAERCGQFYVNNRWLGGLMTNFQTVQESVKKMKNIEAMKEDGRFEMLTKKERLGLEKQHEGLMKNLAGIRDMTKLPDMLFIIDVRKEDIAVAEANRLNIPIVAVVDTNCSPEGITQVIPGNDDALRAIRLFASRIADAILEGQNVGTEGAGTMTETSEETGETAAAETSADIQVADRTWETAEATHEDSTAAGAAEEAGASDETEVRSEVETASSEDMVEAREGQTEGEIIQSQEENTEATAG